MIRKYGDIISGGGICAVSVIMFFTTFTFRRLTVSKIGPAFVPQIMTIFLALLGLIVLVGGIRKLRTYAAAGDAVMQDESPVRVKAVAASLIAMFIYILLLNSIGFVIMSSLYLFAQFFILMHKDERKYLRMIIAAVSLSVVVYIVFVFGFQLRLPAGLL